jgi:hypothetical protein
MASRHGPFSLLFGRSVDHEYEVKPNSESRSISEEELIARNKSMMEVIFPEIRKTVQATLLQNAVNMEKNRRTVVESLSAGTQVMILDINREQKLEPKWVGIYKVKERKGNSYVLIDATNTQLKRLVPFFRSKSSPTHQINHKKC